MGHEERLCKEFLKRRYVDYPCEEFDLGDKLILRSIALRVAKVYNEENIIPGVETIPLIKTEMEKFGFRVKKPYLSDYY